MLDPALSVFLFLLQLSGPGSVLPQILHPDFKQPEAIKAGVRVEVTVSFNILKGYAINRMPPISLKLGSVGDVVLPKTDFMTSPEDPKSQDEYYVDLPTIKVPMTVQKKGKYEIPGKLVYFFCSKTDGFCYRQNVDVKIPVTVQ